MGELFQNSSAEDLIYYSGHCLNSSDISTLNNGGPILNKLHIFVYLIWSPIINLTGFVGNTFCAIVLKRQFEKEEMYYFQLTIIIVEALNSLADFSTSFLYPFLFHSTAGPNFVKYSFLLSNYICIQTVMSNMFENTLILLITATNLDRLQVMHFCNLLHCTMLIEHTVQ